MTLVTRVSLFFLLALGVCLFGYSALLFAVVRSYLHAEFDQQLRSARDVLTAAIEVEDDDAKWQPSDHAVRLGDEQDAEEIRWVIADEEGRVVDRSQNLLASHGDDLQRLLRLARTTDSPSDKTITSQSWRLLMARLKAPAPKPPSERDADESAELTVVVGRNAAALQTDLNRLLLLVCGLPLGFWVVAAIAGRAYCRKALAPVRAMAARAASAGETSDFNLRLPVASRQDELAELATVFNELLDHLQQAYERQRRFAGDAAHQLRTPVTVLRGQIDVALRRPRDESSSRETLTILREQTAELQQILESLLFLARAEPNADLPNTIEINVPDWLVEVEHQWRDHPRSADLHFHAEPGTIRISPSLWNQLINNLIQNACQYSPHGTPVTIRAATEGTDLKLSVTDEGMGIEPQEAEKIFQPFYRAVPARRSGIPGTGLGLAIAAQIAQAHQAHLEYHARQPTGSAFIVRLPRVGATPTANSPA